MDKKESLTALFNGIDTDKDGYVTQAEVEAYQALMPPEYRFILDPAVPESDTNKDEKVSLEEWLAATTQQG
ncbi:hypothetical protein [Streptomyces sp. NPDC090056]|uniref:hypothetical protein n=1 Tax=Streptomyces sp. NPDC090056 TaxID=3365934 RepID=UPI00380D7165